MSLQDALLGKTAGAQTAVVKQFRSEITNGWVHSPCLREEESHGFWNCLAVSKQILERGFLCPGRMAALEGALQLLGIANEDQVLGGLRNGDDIGEGHSSLEVLAADLGRDREVRQDGDGTVHFLTDCGLPFALR